MSQKTPENSLKSDQIYSVITVNGKLLMQDNSIYHINSNVCFVMRDVKKSFSKI